MAKVGDVGFVMHHDNRISRVLSWFMQSQWSHSFMVIGADDFRTYVCETSDFTVTVGYLERYTGDPNCTFEVWSPKGMTDETRNLMANAALKNYNTLYGYLQLLSLGIRRLLMRMGIKVPNFIRQGIVCDELVLSGLDVSGIPGFQGFDAESIDTEELYQKILQSGAFERVI